MDRWLGRQEEPRGVRAPAYDREPGKDCARATTWPSCRLWSRRLSAMLPIRGYSPGSVRSSEPWRETAAWIERELAPTNPDEVWRSSPAHLAHHLDPVYQLPPHIRLMDRWIAEAFRGERNPNSHARSPGPSWKIPALRRMDPDVGSRRRPRAAGDPCRATRLPSRKGGAGRSATPSARMPTSSPFAIRRDTTAVSEWTTTAGGGMKTTGVGGVRNRARSRPAHSRRPDPLQRRGPVKESPPIRRRLLGHDSLQPPRARLRDHHAHGPMAPRRPARLAPEGGALGWGGVGRTQAASRGRGRS